MAQLIPHLAGIETFAEPCGSSEGAIVRGLTAAGLRCVYCGDIRHGQDALARDHYNNADAIITNVPYTRGDMHELIEHFLHVGPQSYLIIDHAWSASQWSGPFLQHCSDIVPVKRITWFEGTAYSEKRSHAWHRFDIRHLGGPHLHDWGDRRKPVASRRCKYCRTPYQPPLLSSRFCSSACRQQAYRERFGVEEAAE